jgi:hypothetical protein
MATSSSFGLAIPPSFVVVDFLFPIEPIGVLPWIRSLRDLLTEDFETEATEENENDPILGISSGLGV